MSDGDESLSRPFLLLRYPEPPSRRWIDEVEVLDEVPEFRTGPEEFLIFLFVCHIVVGRSDQNRESISPSTFRSSRLSSSANDV